MARPLRIEFDGAWYHVMNRGAGRRPIFRSAKHRAMFLKLLGEISAIYGIEIHGYCLMRNHYHLVVRTPRGGLGRAMRHLNGLYTQRFNRDLGTDGPLFRGRYKAVLIGGDPQLRCVSRYVHLNPVDANLVARPEDYRASSYRAYLGLEVAPWWLIVTEILTLFGPGDARLKYKSFVESGIDEPTRAFYARARISPVFGSREFRNDAEARARQSGADTDPERPDYALLAERPGLEAIADAVCRAFELPLVELRPASRRRRGSIVARGVFVLLGREVGGLSLPAIAEWVGYRSYAGASTAMARARRLMARRLEIRERVEAARRELSGPAGRSG